MDNLDVETNQNNPQIIGIACSAATVNSLKTIISSLPEKIVSSFVIFQDLSQPQEENLAELLQEVTTITVQEIVNTAYIEPNHIYVIPESSMLILDNDILKIKRQTREEKTSECLDHFFEIIAEKFGENALGIMLEWSTTDGGFGLKKIREKGGISIAAIDQIGFSLNESNSSYFDYFTKPFQVAEQLIQIQNASQYSNQTTEEQHIYDTIIDLTGSKAGASLQKYNQLLVQQKIAKRMVVTKQTTTQKYLNILKDNPVEQYQLFYEIHNSTAFFQNSAIDYELLIEKAFPDLIEKKTGTDLRIWSAGCSTGEEVYLVAIVLDEFLNKHQRNDLSVKIFATDFSIKNIEKARAGIYSEQDLKYLDERRISQYFIKKDNNWHVSRIIRDNCVFAVHDLTKDFPFSSIDLISCRNVLNVFDEELRQQVVASFHYSLKSPGFLHLGKNDNPEIDTELFEATSEKGNLFIRKNIQSRFSTRPVVVKEQNSTKEVDKNSIIESVIKDFRKITAEVLAEQYAPAAVLINERFEIVHFNGDTSPFLQPPAGTPSFNILNMVHHEVRSVLKNSILTAGSEKRNQKHNVTIVTNKSFITSIEVVYLPMHTELLLVIFNKIPLKQIISEAAKQDTPEKNFDTENDTGEFKEMQQLYFEELQTTNEELLKRTEELESINEQLVTVAEELRSNNEELSCTNDELNDRRNELSVLQNLHASVLKNLKEPVLIMDQHFIIHSANPAFYRYFRINEEQVEGFSILEGINTQWISPEFKELVLQKINRREMVQDVSVTFKAGTALKTCFVHSSVIEHEQHNRIMLTFKDTTELEQIKKQISIQSKKQQEYIRKLESFTISATDKLLDPIRKIHMFGKKIADSEKALTQSGKYSLERLLNTSQKLDRLIEDLLLYSRIHFEQKKPKKTDLNQILRKVINELRNPIKESGAVIESDELPQMPVIACQMRILFISLIANALQFSKETSPPILKIGMRSVKDISHEKAGFDSDTEYVKISFNDNGQGFPQDYENLVFDPFYKLHRDEKQHGAGLGLALVKQIVYNHHGLVKVTSAPGEGTSVHIYLPAVVSFEEHYSPN
nr:CheR family methyltransferase [uncultured Flavobacterium sp.]